MEPPSPYRIAFSNDSGRRFSTDALQKVARIALARYGLPPGELSLRFTVDSAIRELNRTYRGIDAPTDVLTFSAAEIPLPPRAKPPLGDIVISVDQAQRQADHRGYPLEAELAYLVIHGVLHLAGMDDQTDSDREAMLAAMERLGAEAELPTLGEWHTLTAAGAPA